MTVGSHTWSHKDLAKNPYAKDIEQAKQEIEMGVSAVHMAAAGGPIAPFFRFPDLQQPPELMAYLGTRNIATFSTDIDTFDFKLRKPEDVIKSAMTKLAKNGKGILLMHDFQHNTAEATARTAAPAQSRRLQDRAHGAEGAGHDAGEIRRHGQSAGQILDKQQHAPGIERRQNDQRVKRSAP